MTRTRRLDFGPGPDTARSCLSVRYKKHKLFILAPPSTVQGMHSTKYRSSCIGNSAVPEQFPNSNTASCPSSHVPVNPGLVVNCQHNSVVSMVRASAPSLERRRFKLQPSHTKDLKCYELLPCLMFSISKVKSTDNPHRLATIGRSKFLLWKCPAECGEKGGAIVVTSLVPREPCEVMTLPPSFVVVFVSSNSRLVLYCVVHVRLYVHVCGISTTGLRSRIYKNNFSKLVK